MPSGITRGRVTSCCFLVTPTSTASSSLFNVAIDWVGSCAITIKRRRDRTPKVQSRTLIVALRSGDRGASGSRFATVIPTLALQQARLPYELRVLPPFQFFDQTP